MPDVAAIFDAPVAEALGALFGVTGAWLVAAGSRRAFAGFVCFLVSNVFWIWFAVGGGHHWLVLQQVIFTGSSLLGLWRWRPAGGS